jgi:hypothetical protein
MKKLFVGAGLLAPAFVLTTSLVVPKIIFGLLAVAIFVGSGSAGASIALAALFTFPAALFAIVGGQDVTKTFLIAL